MLYFSTVDPTSYLMISDVTECTHCFQCDISHENVAKLLLKVLLIKSMYGYETFSKKQDFYKFVEKCNGLTERRDR